jgi:protein-disulfide isomerase
MAKTTCFILSTIMLMLFCIPSGFAQKRTTRTNEELKALRQEIESVKEGQAAIQKTLDEIKELLKARTVAAQPQPAPTPQVILDIAGAPTKGDVSARVVLVDFSDYQ